MSGSSMTNTVAPFICHFIGDAPGLLTRSPQLLAGVILTPEFILQSLGPVVGSLVVEALNHPFNFGAFMQEDVGSFCVGHRAFHPYFTLGAEAVAVSVSSLDPIAVEIISDVSTIDEEDFSPVRAGLAHGFLPPVLRWCGPYVVCFPLVEHRFLGLDLFRGDLRHR